MDNDGPPSVEDLMDQSMTEEEKKALERAQDELEEEFYKEAADAHEKFLDSQ